MNIEEIEDEIKSVSRKRDKLILEVNKYQNKVLELSEKYYELNPEYVKIECIRCNGIGYISGEDKKKHICEICNGNQYNWLKLYKENQNENRESESL